MVGRDSFKFLVSNKNSSLSYSCYLGCYTKILKTEGLRYKLEKETARQTRDHTCKKHGVMSRRRTFA